MTPLGLFFVFLICVAFISTAYDTLSWVRLPRFRKRRPPKKPDPEKYIVPGSYADRKEA